MLPKTYFMSETKCLAVCYGQSMTLNISCFFFRNLLEKDDFVLSMKAQITQNKISFPMLFFVNYAKTRTGAHCSIIFG